ncbi:MAG: aminotransferase class V-fold PLP-dependent enzyme, partial [Allobaculum sp.]|nr:aminotransferase class V-fold PLP-dependent enzyme [Allobaculum sp.]
ILESRQAIAQIAATSPENVVFSSTSTDALNTIIFGLSIQKGDTVYVSPFEHNSIIRPLKSGLNLSLQTIPFDPKTWELDVDKLKEMFELHPPKAVFISEVSNVTGFELPWTKIFALSKPYKAINILDASQSFAPDRYYAQKNISLLVFNGHKSLYGPIGVGGFIFLEPVALEPSRLGGTGSDSLSFQMPSYSPDRYEAGTHNVAAIATLKDSIGWLRKQDSSYKSLLGDTLLQQLRTIPGIHVYAPDNISTNGIVSFNLESYTASELAEILDQDFGLALRGGYHCSPLVHHFIQSEPFYGTVRASFSYFNTLQEVEKLVSALQALSEELF